MQEWLIILFLGMSFFMCIHMLNMLIAIMGETFASNNETKKMQNLRSHLRFVMDNWWIDPIKDKHKIKYLITAFLKDDAEDEIEILSELKEFMQNFQLETKRQAKRILLEIMDLKN